VYEAEREAAIEGARAAGAVLLGHFRKLAPGSVSEKGKNDLVSIADQESERMLLGMLRRAFPADGFVGEEGGGVSPAGPGRRWIVDPLDGTLNFVQGFAHWCVSVALWDDQGPLVGCVVDPIKGDEFVAVRGQGATWNGAPARVSNHEGLDGAFVATGFAYQLGERFPRLLGAIERVFPRAKAIRRAGSAALDLAYVAAGIHDGYFELGLRPWDQAAGALLVLEAGGALTDWQGGPDWDSSGDVVAGPPGVQRELLACVR
jgi:myo-inositol-1(or 4)-monophosphatase